MQVPLSQTFFDRSSREQKWAGGWLLILLQMLFENENFSSHFGDIYLSFNQRGGCKGTKSTVVFCSGYASRACHGAG